MNRFTGILLAAICGVVTIPSQIWGQNKIILHNTNNYPIWVAAGNYGEGVMSLTGGPHAPDHLDSWGWYKIGANENRLFDNTFDYLYVRAYSLNAKTWFQIKPPGQQRSLNFFYKMDNFNEKFLSTPGLAQAAKNKGGELKPYYPLRTFWNQQRGRYELTGPVIQGGEPTPVQPLPAAVATVMLRNNTKESVNFTIYTGETSFTGKLTPGQTKPYIIRLGNPPATVTVFQNDGTSKKYNLVEGATFVFQKTNGQFTLHRQRQ